MRNIRESLFRNSYIGDSNAKPQYMMAVSNSSQPVTLDNGIVLTVGQSVHFTAEMIVKTSENIIHFAASLNGIASCSVNNILSLHDSVTMSVKYSMDPNNDVKVIADNGKIEIVFYGSDNMMLNINTHFNLYLA